MTKKRSNIMLCYPLEERRLIEPKFGWTGNFPIICQPKLDGVRCRAICNGTQAPVLLSSTETIIKSVPHINDAIRQQGLDEELDGELYIHGEDFETINSIVSRTINIHEDYDKIEFHIFDIVSEAPQLQRLAYLTNYCNFKTLPIEVVQNRLAYSFQDIMRIYEEFLDLGYEGIIVRHKLAPYIRRRSTYVLKFKAKKEDIYKIVGYKEEISIEGKPKNRLGAIICIGNDIDEFSVGSGLNDETRVSLWKDKEALVGKYLKVAYQSITAKKGVPRFPIFMEVIDYGRALERDPQISIL